MWACLCMLVLDQQVLGVSLPFWLLPHVYLVIVSLYQTSLNQL